MARYFDSVTQAPILGYEEEMRRRGQLDEILAAQAPAFQGVTPEQAPMVQQAGFIPGQNQGEFITPERALTEYQNQRILGMQDSMRQRYEDTLSSPIFRAGDTLADVGRFFLSPLIFLKGEDMSKYDPSGRVKAGYRERFEQLESLRVQNVQKFLEARDARQANYMNMVTTMRQAGQPLSSAMKELQDFAALTGQLDAFQSGDPAAISDLQSQMQVQKGDAFQLSTGRVVPKSVYDKVDQYANDFTRNTAGYRSAYEGYGRLMQALSFESGIADIAAVFSFMKALDPTSVVREGEFNVTANAGGLWDRLTQIQKKVESGEILPEAVKGELAQVATALMESYTSSYQDLRNTYTGRAGYIGFDSEDDINALFGSPLQLPGAPSRGMFLNQPKPNPPPQPGFFDGIDDVFDKYMGDSGG
jgi:hypothetical protein